MKIGPNPDCLRPEDERTAFQALLDFERTRWHSKLESRKALEVVADRLATMCAKISMLEEANSKLNRRLEQLSKYAEQVNRNLHLMSR